METSDPGVSSPGPAESNVKSDLELIESINAGDPDAAVPVPVPEGVRYETTVQD